MSNIFRSRYDVSVAVKTGRGGRLSSIMQVGRERGNKGWCGAMGLRPDEDIQQLRSRLMHLVEHQLSGDTSLWAVELTGSTLKRSNVLLYNLIEEHGG